MTKLFKLTPFLLAAFPVIFLYDQNKNELTQQILWWPMFLVIILAGFVFFIVRFFEKNSTKSVLIASLAVVILLYYGFGYDIMYGSEFYGVIWGRHKYLFPLWIFIGVGGLYWLKITKRNLDNLLQAVCFSVFIMILMPVWGSVHYNLTKPDTKKELANSESANLHFDDKQKINSSGPLPDIYYIIPDAYAGPKVLERYFNFDNREFYEYLKKKGFDIAQNSRSSYPNTYFSVASTLNMEYINHVSDILGKDSNDYNPIRQILNDNRVLKQLKSAGYKYVHLDSDYTTFLEGDSLAVETPLDIFSRMFMKFTVLRPFGGRYGFKENAINNRLRDNVLAVFESLERITVEGGPKFVFAHITSPHGPYVFNRNGERVDSQFSNNIEEMGYYIDQLIFVNNKLITLVDKILSNSKIPPIVIIQSDHGFYVPPEVLIIPNYDTLKFNIRMANFSAYYLPKKKCNSVLPQSLNTVNTFRFVFDQCFKTKYSLLENKSYYFTNQNRPYNLIEVDYSKDPF